VSDGAAPTRVFYDGTCALCHRLVAFAVARDCSPEGALRFAPLGGAALRRVVGGEAPVDTVVVRTPDGRILARGAAAEHVLGRLCAPWPAIARALSWVPSGVRDAAYDAIARRRRRWFGTTTAACPVVPPEWRERFED